MEGVRRAVGGVATNIGIHFFDLLLWLFGPVEQIAVHLREPKRVAGHLQLRRPVRWFLSTDARACRSAGTRGQDAFRSIVVDGEEIVFTDGFTDLHTRVYEEVLAGRAGASPMRAPRSSWRIGFERFRSRTGCPAGHPILTRAS